MSNSSGKVNALAQHYKTLGCTPTDPDSYITYAFESQLHVDPNNIPKYASAIAHLAEDTGSGDLQMAVAKANSEGHWSSEEVTQAYIRLGFQPTKRVGGFDDPQVTDDQVMDAAVNRTSEHSSAPDEQRAIRAALAMLASARQSQVLRVRAV